MKLPEASENIYPRSRENFKAILDRYFQTTPDALIEQSIEKLMEDKTLAVNQVEFGAKFTNEFKELLDQAKISKNPSARIHFAIEAIFVPEANWSVWGETAVPLRKFRELFRNSFFKEWPN